MAFEFSDEHEELRRTVRQFLENESDETKVRDLMMSEAGFERSTWQQMAEELGLTGLIIPEVHGGAEFGVVELAIVMEEMGRALLCAPYLSSAVLATSAILLAADETAQKELLPKLASGEATATLAFCEHGASWNLSDIAMTAEGDGANVTLTGEKTYVLDGVTADEILVAARSKGELTLYRLDPDAVGLTRTALPPLDPTRKLAHLRFEKTPAARISSGDVEAELGQTLDRALTALAAEQLGGAQRCLEMATDYAKTRIQFGRPIGSYQAIKHQCADMLVAVEFSRSAAYNAAFAIDEGDAEASVAAAMAKSFCSDAYSQVAKRNLQVHGGMGFTWEAAPHLYLKRAKSTEKLFGSPIHHRATVAAAVGIASA